MKKSQFFLSFITLLTLFSVSIEGKDNKGKSGDRADGSHRHRDSDRRSNTGGERSIQRHQSVRRPSQQVQIPQTQTSSPQINRPNNSASQINRPSHRSHVQSDARSQARNQVQQFIKSNKPARHHGDRGKGQARYDGRFREEGKHIRNQIGSHYHNRGDWFNRHFWDRHHYRPSYYNYNYDWWLPATSVAIGTWLGWDGQPYYYDSYDDFGYAAYPSDYYFEDTYVPQTGTAVASDEWMPLGVFVVATNGRSVTTPSMFIQLALKKNGELAGTYYNAILDQNYELEGMVNSDSQLAAWKISNNLESPVFQTGIFNLSQDEVPVRVYFQNNTTQDWLLVRMNQ